SLPLRSGGSCPEGAEGGALDPAFGSSRSRSKACPLPACRPPSPAARGKGQPLARRLVLSLPLRSGGHIGRTADLHAEGARRANAMDGVSAPAPKGVKGALLILL